MRKIRESAGYLLIAALASIPAAGQQPTFSANSNLVIVDVTVKDKAGKPIRV